MKQFIRLLFIVMLLSAITLVAQEEYCGTDSNVPDFLQTIPQNQRKSSKDHYLINLHVHTIQKSDGSGGRSMEDIMGALNILINHFEPHGIQFCLKGIYPINDNTVYELVIDQYNLHLNDILPIGTNCYNKADGINIFFGVQFKDYWGGVASGIPGTTVFLRRNLDITSNSISHEVGHCFGLFHTFHGLCRNEGGCPELVDGSNCDVCGDFVCDTPADPTIGNKDISTCEWNGITCNNNSNTDANGDHYLPDPANLMAYSPSLCREYFTQGQGERMRIMIAKYPELQLVINTEHKYLSNITFNTTNKVVEIESEKSINISNTTIVHTTMEMRAGDSIVFLPGTLVGNGSDFIAYTDTNIVNECMPVSKDRKKKSSISALDNRKEIQDTTCYEDEPQLSPEPIGLEVFPNPAHDVLYFRYTLPGLSTVSIQLFNETGSIIDVIYSDILQQEGTHTIQYNLPGNKQGLIFCRLIVNNLQSEETNHYIEKLIIAK
jgi:hypothetical protein